MNAVFNQLIIGLQNKILADIPHSPETPGFSAVEPDLGQLEIYEQRPPVAFNCVLVDYISTNYIQKQLKAQWAEMQIGIRLAFDPWDSSSSMAPQDIRERAFSYYELENKFYLSIQDWNCGGLLMLPMKRVSAASEKREDKFRVRQLLYKATYEDRGLQLL